MSMSRALASPGSVLRCACFVERGSVVTATMPQSPPRSLIDLQREDLVGPDS